MRLLSPAKVNLHLRILGKRTDGYHEIQTLMQAVDLFDQVEIFLQGQGITLFAENQGIPGGMQNLACRAAQALLKELHIQIGVQIHLQKRIPVAAGMGGGSSNAATVLMGMNALLEKHLSRDRLLDLGAKVGADVPFFIFQKPSVARGMGEKLQSVDLPEPLWFLLFIPPLGISTAWAYAAYDSLLEKKGVIEKTEPVIIKNSYDSLADLLPLLENDLEKAVFPAHPQIAQMKKELLAQGARGALMSGSGPVLFGLFLSRQEAERIGQTIPLPEGWKTVIAQGIKNYSQLKSFETA